MIPSANTTAHQTGDHTWHSAADTWPDQAAASAAVHYSGLDSKYLNLNRQQIVDWENAMLLAQHSNNNCSVYDQVADYKPTIMQAEAIDSIANSRQYDGLLSVNMNSSGLSQNTWGLLNTVGARSSGGLQHEGSLIQASSAPYNYGSLGASAMGGYSSFGANGAAASLYGDPLAARSSVLGLTSFEQRRLEDIVKREFYTTHDFNSRLGLNLGGRTYFSADDYTFGRFGKRLRPNSPSMMQAPLCQAEGCKADLSMAKHYHRRHKVCEYHSKAATVNIGDQTQRFCQQCSRFHVLSEFDDGKRSCRKRLADHNRRRRKPQPVSSIAVDAEAKDSQEATGSESLQNGGQSSKGSPAATVGEQPLALASTTPLTGLSSGHDEGGKSKMQVSEESMDKNQQKEAPASKSFKLECAIATSNIAASLSLGAKHDKQAENSGESGGGAHFNGAGDKKRTVPWLQASANKQLVGGSYNTKADHNSESSTGEGDHKNHAEKVAAASMHSSIQNLLPTLQASRLSSDQSNIENGSSWVMKSIAAAAEAAQQGSDQELMGERDINLINHRLSGKSGGGGHEVLRLMGDERELMSSKHKPTNLQHAMHASSVATLGFLEHPALNPSSFSKAADNIKFSSLHQQADLTRPLSRSSIFGSDNHLHNSMI